jgi:hypothetical protein
VAELIAAHQYDLERLKDFLRVLAADVFVIALAMISVCSGCSYGWRRRARHQPSRRCRKGSVMIARLFVLCACFGNRRDRCTSRTA